MYPLACVCEPTRDLGHPGTCAASCAAFPEPFEGLRRGLSDLEAGRSNVRIEQRGATEFRAISGALEFSRRDAGSRQDQDSLAGRLGLSGFKTMNEKRLPGISMTKPVLACFPFARASSRFSELTARSDPGCR